MLSDNTHSAKLSVSENSKKITNFNNYLSIRMKYTNIREESLKNKVGADWFNAFDTTEILGNIDFTVFP